MRLFTTILVFCFLTSSMTAQYSKKDLFLTTTPTSLIQINKLGTVWIGAEYFITQNMSLHLNLGHIYGKEEENKTLLPLTETPFLSNKFNVRTDFTFRYFLRKGWYNGINLGYNQINYGAEREIVKSWQERDNSIEISSAGEAVLALVLFPILVEDNLNYDRGFEPLETEFLFQHIRQHRYSIQYLFGWSGTSKQFQFDIFTGIGRQWIHNKLVEGERHAVIPNRLIPNKNHLSLKYQNIDLSAGIKIGWMLNYNDAAK